MSMNGNVQRAGEDQTLVVVGLGNPGPEYARNRHNLGFMVVDELAREVRARWEKRRNVALVSSVRIGEVRALLVKPQTFMNRSGHAVFSILGRARADPARMIVVHDDLDLAPGSVRIKTGGGDGGHKGVRSIADSLRFRDFIRIRMGVGRPPPGSDATEFVLTSFSAHQEEYLRAQIALAVDAVRLVVTEGEDKAKNAIHSRKIGSGLPDQAF